MILTIHHPPTIGIIGLAILWLVWRLWTFTIYPKFNKDAPTLIPYPVPWFGHIVGFFRDGNTLITRSRLRYASNREPFNILLAGESTYIITSGKDTVSVFRNVTDLTFDAYVRDMMLRLGASQEGFRAMWAKPSTEFAQHRVADNGFPNPNRKPLIHACEDIFKAQLHPGPAMEVLQSNLVLGIQKCLSWESVAHFAVVGQQQEGMHEYTVSLKNWIQTSLLEAATRAFFGEKLFKVEPKLLEIFASFDSNSWRFTYNLPRWFAQKVHSDKEKLQSAFIRYVELPCEERSDACWMVKTLEKEMRAVGTNNEDIGAYLLMLFWPIQGNPWKVAFWFMSYLLYNPDIKRRIAAEVSSTSQDLSKGLNECPLLTASYNEVLRVTSSTITVRDVVNDCVVGGKLLRRKSRVLIPYRQMFLDETVFGPDVDSFCPERFLNNPSLAKDPSFRPFGGGLTYCPGRFIAQTQIFTIIAELVTKLDVQVEDLDAPFPEMDEKKPGLGTMFPAEHADVLVRVMRR